MTGNPMDQKYIVCNQDEPYAEEVARIILEGEARKNGTEPAKVSEDVERERAEEVAELHAALRITISRLSDLAREDPPSKRLKAQALSFADRLVARIKESNR
jgi:hypothetical protein